MKLKVPYSSQYADVSDISWQPCACGVACLKMLLDWKIEKYAERAQTVVDGVQGKIPLLDTMIQDGVTLGAYSDNGWLHEGLIALGKKYGAELSRKEFRKKGANSETAEKLNNEGVVFVIQKLEEGNPVIVSAIKKFAVRDKFHMVVLVGFEKEEGEVTGFYYHDSDFEGREEGKNLFVPLDILRTNWRRMIIF